MSVVGTYGNTVESNSSSNNTNLVGQGDWIHLFGHVDIDKHKAVKQGPGSAPGLIFCFTIAFFY